MDDTADGEAVPFGLEEVSESLSGKDGGVGCEDFAEYLVALVRD